MEAIAEVAVVVDTNFVGRGNFRLGELKKLAARLQKRGHRLLIPEVVVWEWAEHAHTALQRCATEVQQTRNRVDGSLGIAVDVPNVPTVEMLIGTITKLLHEAGAEVVETDPDAAATGIQHQVTQNGMGSKKTGVKTGAADSLVLHVVQIQTEEMPVILCTNDKQLAQAAADTSDQVRIAHTRRELWDILLVVAPAKEDFVQQLQDYVLETVREELAAYQRDLLVVGQPYIDRGDLDELGFHMEDSMGLDVTLEHVESIHLDDVDVYSDEDPPFASAQVRALCELQLINWFFGGEDLELIDEWSTDSGQLTTQITVDLDRDLKPVGFDVDGPPSFELAGPDPD